MPAAAQQAEVVADRFIPHLLVRMTCPNARMPTTADGAPRLWGLPPNDCASLAMPGGWQRPPASEAAQCLLLRPGRESEPVSRRRARRPRPPSYALLGAATAAECRGKPVSERQPALLPVFCGFSF